MAESFLSAEIKKTINGYEIIKATTRSGLSLLGNGGSLNTPQNVVDAIEVILDHIQTYEEPSVRVALASVDSELESIKSELYSIKNGLIQWEIGGNFSQGDVVYNPETDQAAVVVKDINNANKNDFGKQAIIS